MRERNRTYRWLVEAATAAPEQVAVYEPGLAPLTYGELAERAAAAATGLPNERACVEIELAPGIAHAVAVHAAFLAGRAALTIRPGLPPAEREAVLAAGRLGDPSPGVAARVLSSGTGGARRPIDLTFANFEASAAASAANLGAEEDDVWLACLPMDHVGGLSILIRSAIYRSATLIHPRFDAEAVAASLAASSPRVTAISLVPTQLARLVNAGADFSGLRFALIGGAPLSRGLLERALDAGVPVAATYGLTEACSQVTTLPPPEARVRAGSSGRPLPGVEVRIGRAERIEVRGPTVAPGAAGADGWLRTGDIGRLDADGYLWVEGRADDLIVTGGENVRPEPVEDRLRQHPAVADAAVVGAPDPEWGQAVVAFVQLERPGDPRNRVSEGRSHVVSGESLAGELIDHCRDTLPPAAVPKRIEIVDSLPRTASGKLQRARLRARLGR